MSFIILDYAKRRLIVIFKLMRNIVLLFFCCLSIVLQAQSYTTKNKKAIKAYEQGITMLRSRDFDNGLAMMEKAVILDPAFIEARLRLAKEYRMFRRDDLIKEHLKAIVELRPSESRYATVYHDLAKLYLKEGDYNNAEPLLKTISLLASINPRLKEFAVHELDRIAFVQEQMANPLDVKPRKMGSEINYFQFNSNPVLTADRKTMIYSVKSGRGKYANEDIVVAINENSKWQAPKSISENINNEHTGEGFASISGDGKTMVFAAADRKDCLGRVDLYISFRVGDTWSEPINMGPKVNSEAWDSEPSISADGRTIYFSSDRKGGLGQRDIYKTTMDENGIWGAVQNVGGFINTNKSEVTPVIHADGRTLLYASDGGLGFGGYDIFYSTFDDKSGWAKGKNIGYPLNTAENEGALFITSDYEKGYFEKYFKPSESQGAYSFIYEFDVPDALKINKACTYANGSVRDILTRQAVKATVEIINLRTKEREQLVTSDSISGKYLAVLREGQEYGVYVSANGYLFHSENFDYTDISNSNPVALDIELIPLSEKKEIELPNIFFETGKYALKEKSFVELDRVVDLMMRNESIAVEIGGHTDNVGSSSSNVELSTNRALSVKKYLVSKGVGEDRVKTKGYGSTKPKYDNNTDIGRAKNRRIELKVI